MQTQTFIEINKNVKKLKIVTIKYILHKKNVI